MAMDKKTVKIQIGGIDYSLKSSEEPEYVGQIAKYVDEKIERLAANTNVKSQTKIAVLVALNIADEFFQLKKQYEKLARQLESIDSRSKELCNTVDSYLDRNPEKTH